MRLIHTMLFLFRGNRVKEDMEMIASCLKSLEKSTYKTVIVYNQGFLTNGKVKEYLEGYGLDFHVIGEGTNSGTTIGRQRCFEYIWENFPDTDFISEIHPDMIFCDNWEDMLVDYLDSNDEALVSCGIIDQKGNMPFLGKVAVLPENSDGYNDFLISLREDRILHGFSTPCIHASKILKHTGGYNQAFLKGKQCYEDDSMLLGYYYYYGTRMDWYPKINYNSVVYHATAGQRISVSDNVAVNFNGLVKQYGLIGLKHLSTLHKSAWHKNYFLNQYNRLIEN